MVEKGPDITVTPFFITIDVVQNCYDIGSFFEFIKSNYKKDIIILNAQDYIEKEGARTKSDGKSVKSKHDSINAIIRSMKNKIDLDIAKCMEAQKKQMAALEKHKDAKPGKTNKGRPKSSLSDDSGKSQQLFQGKIDVLYIITNFPYLPSQLRAMFRGGIELSAFFSIVPVDGVVSSSPFTYRPIEKNSKAINKKPLIPGLELDFTQNPNCYPPARWGALQPQAPFNLPFIEIRAGYDHENMFQNLENAVITTFRAREQFQVLFGSRKITKIPSKLNNCELSSFVEYLNTHPGDYVNAIFSQLQKNKWVNKPPQSPPSDVDIYNGLFSNKIAHIKKTTVMSTPKEIPDPIFNIVYPYSLIEIVYPLLNWKMDPNFSENALAITQLLLSPSGFMAYAGSKFDHLVMSINKKYQLGLPQSYFDWQSYSLVHYDQSINEFLEPIMKNYSLYQVDFDESVGLLWVLALPPVSKTQGIPLSNFSMPQTLNGISEWMEKLFDKPSSMEKKQRATLSPSSVIKNHGDPLSVLPSMSNRLASTNGSLYQIPIKCSNSCDFSSPYVFNSNLRITVNRNVRSEEFSFGIKAQYNDMVELSSNSKAFSFIPFEDIKIIYTPKNGLNLLFYEQSIYFNGKQILVKTTQENPLIIHNNGSVIMKDRRLGPIVIFNDGTIGHMADGEWIYIDSVGKTFKMKNGNKEYLTEACASFTYIANNTTKYFRPDNVEYYVDSFGKRRIIFGSEISIEQSDSMCSYEINNYPLINFDVKKSEFLLEIDKFVLSLGAKGGECVCPEYSITFVEQTVRMKFDEDCELVLTPSRCEVRSGQSVLVADADGTESLGHVSQETTSNKKAIPIVSSWGTITPIKETLSEAEQMELNSMFEPFFFLIRSDLSAAQFLRKDSNKLYRNATCYREEVMYPSGEPCNIISYHLQDKEPLMYLEIEPSSKAERSQILKSLHIPKKQKKLLTQDEIDTIYNEATIKLADYLDQNRLFLGVLSNYLAHSHEQFLIDTEPIEPPKPDTPMIPPITPNPRLLQMQMNLHQPLAKGEIKPNYWNHHESDFSFPIHQETVPLKPLSPRCALYDPPISTTEAEEPELSEPCTTISKRSIPTKDVPKPEPNVSIVITPSEILLKPGISKYKLSLHNTGKDPIHYTADPIICRSYSITGIPGSLFPGLTKQIFVNLSTTEILREIVFSFKGKKITVPIRIQENKC